MLSSGCTRKAFFQPLPQALGWQGREKAAFLHLDRLQNCFRLSSYLPGLEQQGGVSYLDQWRVTNSGTGSRSCAPSSAGQRDSALVSPQAPELHPFLTWAQPSLSNSRRPPALFIDHWAPSGDSRRVLSTRLWVSFPVPLKNKSGHFHQPVSLNING